MILDRLYDTTRERQTVFQIEGVRVSGDGADHIVYYKIGLDMFLESPVWGHAWSPST